MIPIKKNLILTTLVGMLILLMIPTVVMPRIFANGSGGGFDDGDGTSGNVAGIQRSVFIAYYLVLILVNQLTYSQTNWTVGDIIREGTLSHWLIRPLSPLYQILSSEIAGKVVYLIFTVPVVILLMVLLKPEFTFSPSEFFYFWVSLLLAWALRFLWGLWIVGYRAWMDYCASNRGFSPRNCARNAPSR